MKLIAKKFFFKDENEYINIVTAEYKGNIYSLSNRINLETDSITDIYNIFTIKNDEIIRVKNQELITELMPIFLNNIRNELEKIKIFDIE